MANFHDYSMTRGSPPVIVLLCLAIGGECVANTALTRADRDFVKYQHFRVNVEPVNRSKYAEIE